MKSPFIALAIFTLLSCAFSPASAQSQPTSADPIVGRWHWCTNQSFLFKADGTITRGKEVLGQWKCVNAVEWPRKYVLDWGHGMWIDTLSLQKDYSLLSGKNQHHTEVHASRCDP